MGEWKTPLFYAIRLLWYTSFLHLKAKSGMECENAELLQAYPLQNGLKQLQNVLLERIIDH